MQLSDIWCEKYRPSTLDEIVLDTATRSYFSKVREDGNIPNVLFVGRPGIGKTTNIANSCFPDFRKGINALQKHFLSGGKDTSVFDPSEFFSGLYDLLKNKKYTAIRKHIIQNENLFNNDYDELFKHLFDYMYSLDIDNEKKRDCLITVSRYFYQNSQCIDQEINFYSCILDLGI